MMTTMVDLWWTSNTSSTICCVCNVFWMVWVHLNHTFFPSFLKVVHITFKFLLYTLYSPLGDYFICNVLYFKVSNCMLYLFYIRRQFYVFCAVTLAKCITYLFNVWFYMQMVVKVNVQNKRCDHKKKQI